MLTLVVLSFTSILPHNLAAPLYAKVAGNNNPLILRLHQLHQDLRIILIINPNMTGSNNNQAHNHGSNGDGNGSDHQITGSNNNQHHRHGSNDRQR